MPRKKTLKAQHIMSHDVVTIQPTATCDELQKLLLNNKITGVPVVNGNDELVGVISLYDILRKDLEIIELDDQQVHGQLLGWLRKGLVSDFMSREVKSAHPETPVPELADLMHENKIHRVIIVDPETGKLSGMVTTFDLMKVLSTAS